MKKLDDVQINVEIKAAKERCMAMDRYVTELEATVKKLHKNYTIFAILMLILAGIDSFIIAKLYFGV